MSQPSYTQNEKMVIEHVKKFCVEHNFDHVVDEVGNIFITKGELDEGEFYPLVGAHMDTVHMIETKVINEDRGILTAFNPEGIQVGIGGDDIAGCHISLELLLMMDKIKVALFIGEEHGCIGSRFAAKNNPKFFENVGYFLEFDGPEDYMITEVCSGITLFDRNTDFFKLSLPLLHESMGDKMRFFSHPYTDVSIIKQYFDFSCINISAGYFNWHSSHEYLVIEEVEKSIILGKKMIETLGNKKHQLSYTNKWGHYFKNKKGWDDEDQTQYLFS
jgi:putative aminopeptidase FrvX